MQEQELFQQYELKGWQPSPRLYKILGASALINLLGFFLLAQSNFLTGKTCDSPLASGVCSVLDALYVGAAVAQSDPRYVDENYIKTELEEAEITYVNVGNWQPLEYPEGYFALANPQDQIPETISTGDPNFPSSGVVSGFPNNPTLGGTGDLSAIKPIVPTPNNDAVEGVLPQSVTPGNKPFKQPRNNRITRPRNPTVPNDSPGALPTDDELASKENKTNKADKTEKTDEVKPIESEPLEEVKINKKVMMDFGNMVKAKVDKKEVDLNQQFKVVVEGVLTKDGRFDRSIDKATKKPKSQITFTEGDPQMVEVGKQALEAVGDSGWLGYLRNLGADNVKITLVQDGEKVYARVETDQKTPDKARLLASGINTLISFTKNNVKLGEDETILLNGAQKPTTDGKMFVLDFLLPKPMVQDMIQRNLKKAAEANQNSTAQTENVEQKTGK